MAKYTLVSYVEYGDFAGSKLRYGNVFYCDSFHALQLQKEIPALLRGNYFTTFVSVHDDLFNFFGHLISNGIVNHNDVDVVLFDEEHNRIDCKYDSQGYLLPPFKFGFWYFDMDMKAGFKDE